MLLRHWPGLSHSVMGMRKCLCRVSSEINLISKPVQCFYFSSHIVFSPTPHVPQHKLYNCQNHT